MVNLFLAKVKPENKLNIATGIAPMQTLKTSEDIEN
jgi:hypothetical protein